MEGYVAAWTGECPDLAAVRPPSHAQSQESPSSCHLQVDRDEKHWSRMSTACARMASSNESSVATIHCRWLH